MPNPKTKSRRRRRVHDDPEDPTHVELEGEGKKPTPKSGVAIEIESGDEVNETNPLKVLLKLLGCNQSKPSTKKWMWNSLFVLQKVFWFTVIGLALFDTSVRLKRSIFAIKQTNSNEIESTYIESGLKFFQLILLWKFLQTLFCAGTTIEKLDASLDNLRSTQRNPTNNKGNKTIPILLVLSSFLLAGIYVLLGFEEIYFNKSWNFKDLCLYQYEDTYSAIHDWNVHSNVTFKEELTSEVVAYSVLGFSANFGSFFTNFILWDLLIVVSLTLKRKIDRMDELRKKFLAETDAEIVVNLGYHIMDSYQALTEVSEQLNAVFGGIITMLHATNMVVFVSFLDGMIYDPDIGGGIHRLTGLIKCMTAYYICFKSSDKVEKLQSWLRDERTRVVLDMDVNVSNFYATMEEMKANPIGLGQGEFYVNWQFGRKYAGIMMTYFFLLAKSKKMNIQQKLL